MSTITFEKFSKLVYDYIAAQAKRDAERDAAWKKELAERDAERKKDQAEWKKELATRDAERKKEQAEKIAEKKKEQAERIAERKKEQAERIAERKKEQAERNAERKKEQAERKKAREDYDNSMKELRREMGSLAFSYGEQVESMFVNLSPKFKQHGLIFSKEARNFKYLDKNMQVLTEVDRLLENGSVIMPVEVKSKLRKDHVDHHIARLGTIRKFITEHGDSRKVIGAIVGGIVNDDVLQYAQEHGLYVLVQNGESVDVAKTPENFIPKEW